MNVKKMLQWIVQFVICTVKVTAPELALNVLGATSTIRAMMVPALLAPFVLDTLKQNVEMVTIVTSALSTILA